MVGILIWPSKLPRNCLWSAEMNCCGVCLRKVDCVRLGLQNLDHSRSGEHANLPGVCCIS